MAISIKVRIFLIIAFSHFLSDKRVYGRKGSTSVMKNHTMQGENGEVIDCVDIYNQPALNHPLLKNHIIHMKPSSSPDIVNKEEKVEFIQSWQTQKYGKCPKGTIPILRTHLFKTRKEQIIIGDNTQPTTLGRKTHETAGVTMLPAKRPYHGTYARIGLWNPETFDGEFSLSEIRLDAGIIGKVNEYNSIEASWMVVEGNPKLFIHWTRDFSNTTGCYNLNCPGFVQVDDGVVLGGEICPVSTYDAELYDLPITVAKDIRSGNWWLRVNKIDIGNWPGSIFTSLAQSARQISWLGHITNSKSGGQYHTSTQMGSGHLPSEGFKKAAIISNIRLIDESGQMFDADHDDNLYTFAVNPNCYEVKMGEKQKPGTGLGVFFYYGGPLYSPRCGAVLALA